MKRPYETMIIFDGSQPDDAVLKEKEKVEKFLKEHADFDKIVPWGKRPLAYDIKKKKTGDYYLFVYQGDSLTVGALEKQLKLNEKVIRFLSVVRDMRVKERPEGSLGEGEVADVVPTVRDEMLEDQD
ncbi:MAG: 30S ribosomal protein S6 [Chitinivibrionales bacterium]|nr:30S ribosomal protein S6 [Chitinivibrionales bacterium]